MEDRIGLLTPAEVEQIVKLVEILERSSFDYLHLEVGDLKLTISKRGQEEPGEGLAGDTQTDKADATRPAPEPPRLPREGPPARTAPSASSGTSADPEDRTLPHGTGVAVAEAAEEVFIRAPIVGRFYAQPEPGAPPFVRVGSTVEEDTTVGLIEVMKVFNAVQAGVRGVITAILVQDGQFVEFGQPLFRVRPA